jgi:hypothetical protein
MLVDRPSRVAHRLGRLFRREQDRGRIGRTGTASADGERHGRGLGVVRHLDDQDDVVFSEGVARALDASAESLDSGPDLLDPVLRLPHKRGNAAAGVGHLDQVVGHPTLLVEVRRLALPRPLVDPTALA